MRSRREEVCRLFSHVSHQIPGTLLIPGHVLDTQASVLRTVALMCLGPPGRGECCRKTYVCPYLIKQRNKMYKWATEQCFIFKLASHHSLILSCTFSVFWIKRSLSILPYYPVDQPRSLTTVVLSFSKSCSRMYSCPTFLSILMGANPPAQLDQSRDFTPIMSPQRVWSLITHGHTQYYRQRHSLCLFLTPTDFLSTYEFTLLCLHLHNAAIITINPAINWILKKSPRLQGCAHSFLYQTSTHFAMCCLVFAPSSAWDQKGKGSPRCSWACVSAFHREVLFLSDKGNQQPGLCTHQGLQWKEDLRQRQLLWALNLHAY